MLPHTGNAQLVTAILSCGDGVVEAKASIPSGHPLCTGARAPAFLGVEVGAQAAAAMEALDRTGHTNSPATRIGQLVRVREATLLVSDLPVEKTLLVTARLDGAAPPVAIYQIEVRVDDAVAMRAVITIHRGTSADSTGSPT